MNTEMLKVRPRRLRVSPTLRSMVRETTLSVTDFVYPLFVVAGKNVHEEIPSMPGVYHLSVDRAVEVAKAAAALGIPSVEIFGLPEYKDEIGSSGAQAFPGKRQREDRRVCGRADTMQL